MTPREKSIRELVLEWVAKAEDDFGFAGLGISHDAPFSGPIAFLCQQCAEKYLKAFLVAHGVEFPKTHSIEELLELTAPLDAGLAESLRDADELSPYGVDIRYPADFPDMSPALAKEAFDRASKVRDAVRTALRDHLGEAGS